MKISHILAVAALSVSLTACAHRIPTSVVTPISTVPHVAIPKADPINPQPVQWKVYNADELKALGAELQAKGGSMTLFTLDESNFKKLNGNLVDVKNYIKQQNEIISYLAGVVNQPSKIEEDAKAATKPK